MARKATGGVVEPKGQRRSWGIRFHAFGKRRFVTLGRPEDGWTRQRAEGELENVLADVRRGIWHPPAAMDPKPAEPKPEPTFHEFATDWLEAREPELRERTCVDYRWRLSAHLLPHFAPMPLSAITIEEVDRYRQAKVREARALSEAREQEAAKPQSERRRLPRPLSNGSINKTIRLLAAILEQAVEYGYLERNSAAGRKRLLRERQSARSYLQPDQVAALLAAAGKLDAEARDGDTGRRRPLLAVLSLAGLRISEALELRWRDISLGGRKLRVAASKTDTGVREVDLTPTLQEVLSEYRTRTRHSGPGELVFPTAGGRVDSPSNVRTRFLTPAVKLANAGLEAGGAEPIGTVTPHSLRRTFISLLLATGADVPYVMAQAGHRDPKTTLGIYAQVIASKADHGAALDSLVSHGQWAQKGTEAADVAERPEEGSNGRNGKPRPAAVSETSG
jgi:integrase